MNLHKLQLILIFYLSRGNSGGNIMKNKQLSLRKWIYTNPKYELNYLDLLMPFNKVGSAHQYIVTSRILDIERFLEGKSFFWQRHLTLLDGIEKLNVQDFEKLDKQFCDLIISLKENGYNPDIDSITISRHPVELLNGTHRLAWISLFEKNLDIPCVSVDDYSIFPVNGDQWLKTINLPIRDSNLIKKRYNKLLHDNEYYLLAIADGSISDILIKEISKYFAIYGEKRFILDLTSLKKLNRLIPNNVVGKVAKDELVFFNLKLDSQLLVIENGKVKSVIISALERRLNIIDSLKDRFWIAHTVSESNKAAKIIKE